MRILVFGCPVNLPSRTGKYTIKQISSIREINVVARLLRGVLFKLKIYPFSRFFYNISQCAKESADNDAVVVFDAMPYRIITKLARKIDSNVKNGTRRFVYLWNAIGYRGDISDLKLGSEWEIVSFDFADAKRNGIRYVSTFFIQMNDPKIDATSENIDLYFVGRNKGRFPLVKTIQTAVEKMSFKTDFRYVSEIKHFFSKKYSGPIPYAEVINQVRNSKCILDITLDRQVGLTQRFMEALWLNKKIMTNNKAIKQYKIYDKSRIFYFNNNIIDLPAIVSFFETPMREPDSDVLQSYNFDEWLKLVLETKNCADDIKNK